MDEELGAVDGEDAAAREESAFFSLLGLEKPPNILFRIPPSFDRLARFLPASLTSLRPAWGEATTDDGLRFFDLSRRLIGRARAAMTGQSGREKTAGVEASLASYRPACLPACLPVRWPALLAGSLRLQGRA